MKIDLRTCKRGDILITSQGSKLEYICPTPWKCYTYLDHVVRYVEDADGKPYSKENYGTRTHDGFVFKNNRIPETDHDVVTIIYDNDIVKNQVVAYKLFRELKSGEITSLFINKKVKLPFNEWLEAESYPTKGFAVRPGWHCTAHQ